jgi:hypothetical protein
LLLPADVNRSYQDKTFEEKAPHYATQNLYAASLTENTYHHKPRFLAFRDNFKLPFKSFNSFGQNEHKERYQLVKDLADLVWSHDRLEKILSE